MAIIKDIFKPIKFKPMKFPRMHGHMTVLLMDKAGNVVEKHDDDNMMTNGIAEYLAECGWMNRSNLDYNSLVSDLLGGLLLWHDPITEDADNVFPASGNEMTGNGADVSNGSELTDPPEMGSFIAAESGEQADHSWRFVWEFTTSQAQGLISAASLTSKVHGYAGAGSKSGMSRTPVSISSKKGTSAGYVFPSDEIVCHVSIKDSCCYTVKLDFDNDKIIIKKYRIPTVMAALNMTQSAPLCVHTSEISMPSEIKSEEGKLHWTDNYDALYLWNGSITHGALWGNGHTQKLFGIDPVEETISSTTLTNSSGDDIYEMFNPIFTENGIAFVNGYYNRSNNTYGDSRVIYFLHRSTGTISKINNSYGDVSSVANLWTVLHNIKWNMPYSVNGDRMVMAYTEGNNLIVDAELGAVRITSGTYGVVSNNTSYWQYPTDSPMVGWYNYLYNGNEVRLYRREDYIATINNLSTPINKGGDRAMKVIYTITFETGEEEE